MSSSHIKVDPTRFSFIKNAVSFLAYLTALIAIFILIPPLKSIGITLFAGAGIEIPFPYRTVVIKNPGESIGVKLK